MAKPKPPAKPESEPKKQKSREKEGYCPACGTRMVLTEESRMPWHKRYVSKTLAFCDDGVGARCVTFAKD